MERYESFDTASPVHIEGNQDRVSGNEATKLSEHQQHSACQTSSETFVGASVMEVCICNYFGSNIVVEARFIIFIVFFLH